MHPVSSLRFAVAALVVACLTALAAYPVHAETPPSITVEGHGEAQGKPDIATITLGIVTQGKTSAEAMEANAKIASGLLTQLRERGIADRDLMTVGLSLNPEYANDTNRANAPKIVGYRAANRLAVRLRDVSKVGSVLDLATAAGVNDISGPTFGVADQQALQDEARKKAAADARRVAELLAQSLGVKLGAIREIADNAGPRPIPEPRLMRAAPAAMGAAPPVEGGELTASASVTVVFDIAK